MIIESFYCKSLVAICSALILAVAIGCDNKYLNVGRVILKAPKEDAWPFQASAKDLYDAVLAERDTEADHKALTEDRTVRLASWVVPAAKWDDMEEQGSGYFPSAGGSQNTKGRAVTTAWVEGRGGSGSWLHIRRVFSGDNSPSNMGTSTGEYEVDFVTRLAKRLKETPPTPPTEEKKP